MKRTAVFCLLGAAVIVAACADAPRKKRHHDDDDDASSGAGATSSGGSAGAGGAHEDPDGPKFLNFGTNVAGLTEGQSLTFNAVLTDPDGVDDVVGGSLEDGNGSSYGAFSASGQAGAFELTLTWSEINEVASIDFAYGASQARTFTAEFRDADGHLSSKDITVNLSCSSGWAGCDGICTDTQFDDTNCGSCGHSCSGDLCTVDSFCESGTCGGEQTDCSSLDDACVVGSCNSSNGSCVPQNLPNGTSCDDGNSCTASDDCTSGVCGGNTITSCINNDDCCPSGCTGTNDNDCGVTGGFLGSFTNLQPPAQATCNNWNTYRAGLSGSFASVTLRGSNDPIGVTCSNSVAATQICTALHNGTTATVACGTRTWAVGVCGDDFNLVDAIEISAEGSICACGSGYVARPCLNNENWGGVNTTNCSPPSQTIEVICAH